MGVMVEAILDDLEGAPEFAGLTVEIRQFRKRVRPWVALTSFDEATNLIRTIEGGIHAGTYPPHFFAVNVKSDRILRARARTAALLAGAPECTFRLR